MSENSEKWSVPVLVDELPETGAHYEISADAPAREAIATMAGLRGVAQLAATFDVAQRGAGVQVIGEVVGRVGQTCVVTLEPIENEVRERVDLIFEPPAEAESGRRRKGSDELPEPLQNGVIDLGTIAIEFLVLGLDPYPRKPGVEFKAPTADKAGESPFVALEKLKKSSG